MKVPAAVVWMERPDGRVLGLTRGRDFADWHLPGGKWEDQDGYEPAPKQPDAEEIERESDDLIRAGKLDEAGDLLVDRLVWYPKIPDLAATACREVSEETGVHVEISDLSRTIDYRTRSGRPVRLFYCSAPAWVPESFPPYPAGQPAWIPPAMLTLPWCSFNHEARVVRQAVEARRA